MKLFDLTFIPKKKPDSPPEPPKEIPILTSSVPTIVRKVPLTISPLKWVVVEGKLGVVTAIDEGSMATVDMVDADGLTYFTYRTPVGNLRLAKFEELPKSRVSHLSPQQAALLGYM